MGCNSTKHPLLLERAGVTTAWMQEVEQCRSNCRGDLNQVVTFPLIPTFSLWRRSSRTCVDIYAQLVGEVEAVKEDNDKPAD